MHKLSELLITANNHLGTDGVDEFWSTGTGQVLSVFLDVLGLMALLAGGFKAWKHIADGKTGQGIKVALGMATLAAFLLFPEMLTGLAELMGKIARTIMDSIGELTG